jgi:plastocyanin
MLDACWHAGGGGEVVTRRGRRRPTVLTVGMLAALGGLVGLVGLGGPYPDRRVVYAESLAAQIVEPTPNFRSWRFQPATLKAAVGDAVVWTNAGGAAHTVTSTGLFDSGSLAPGATFSWRPRAGGTFTYFCSFHPWMTGTLVVAGPAAPASAGDVGRPPLLLLLAILVATSAPVGGGVLLLGWLTYDAYTHRPRGAP